MRYLSKLDILIEFFIFGGSLVPLLHTVKQTLSWIKTCFLCKIVLIFHTTVSQEPITWSLQLPCIFVTAFSQTSLFLVWIYREQGLPTRAHRPIKISAWLISNFLVNISKEKQQRDARLLAIVRVQIRVNKGVPGSRLDKKQAINSWKRHMLCDSVLTYGRNCWEFEHVTKNSMGNEIWSIYNNKYFKIWTFYTFNQYNLFTSFVSVVVSGVLCRFKLAFRHCYPCYTTVEVEVCSLDLVS